MPNEQDPGSQTPDDQNQELDQKIAATVNAAVTSHLKRSLDKAITAALEPALKSINDKLSTFQQPSNDDGDAGLKKSKKNQDDPETVALKDRLAAAEREIQASKDREAAVVKKSREDGAYNAIVQALDGKVKPEFRDSVAKILFHADRKVEFDDDGTPLFKAQKAPYAGADPEDVLMPLRAGVDDWLKSDAAKAFLPAPSQGSGAQPMPRKTGVQTPSNKKPTTDAEKIQAAMAASQRVQQKLGIGG